ncbi:ABC transporter substrate-binding protein [Georgenia alba]|uniref:ABC transporter substrate-binding protein n=1 Tax=Georgenia alba TaxID=2233858 RepID=A0ABW2QDZ6_9MICO
MNRSRTLVASALAVSAVLLTACTPDPGSEPSADGGGDTSGATEEVTIPEQEVDQELHDALPAEIRESGSMVSVNSGSFPPYTIVGSDDQVTGATADLATALGQLLDVEIRHDTVDGLASVLSGMDAGRYDISLGPVGDFTERQQQATFVDWVQEFVVFAVPTGNPAGIEDLDSTCGNRIAVQSAGSAEEVIKEQSTVCEENGQEPIDVQSYRDQPQSVLAVQSGRADAFFSSQAPLTHFVEESGGELELAGTGQPNGFDNLYQGALVPRDSELADVLLAAFEELYANGTYEAIMTKWGLEANMLEEPGINLGS